MTLIAASYNIDMQNYPMLGGSLLVSVGSLAVTYTRTGKLYFSNPFRVMLILNSVTYITEQLDLLYGIFGRVQFINITLSFVSIAFISGLIPLILSKDDRQEKRPCSSRMEEDQ